VATTLLVMYEGFKHIYTMMSEFLYKCLVFMLSHKIKNIVTISKQHITHFMNNTKKQFINQFY